jgi:hypothetical protein
MISIVLSGLLLSQVATPPALQPWENWVLQDSSATCPVVSTDERRCWWPGTLELNVQPSGASFRQSGLTYTNSNQIPLPGANDGVWPINVRVNGVAAPVLNVGGNPMVSVSGVGKATIEGALAWSERPERVRVPAEMPLSLTRDGQSVAAPERDGDELFLGSQANLVREADAPEFGHAN